MKRKIELIMALVLLISVVAASRKLSQLVSSDHVTSKEHQNTVILDPGHGGEDPGKVGINQALEKDVNLMIAKKVKQKLEKAGMKVIMTRSTDQGMHGEEKQNKKMVDMKKRVAVINEVLPPLAVSIHQNSYSQESVNGAQVFYYETSKEGKKAAAVMQKALLEVDPENTRQEKANDTYYLLIKTKAPTIIVEDTDIIVTNQRIACKYKGFGICRGPFLNYKNSSKTIC